MRKSFISLAPNSSCVLTGIDHLFSVGRNH